MFQKNITCLNNAQWIWKLSNYIKYSISDHWRKYS